MENFDIISTYTRQDAIDDGQLFDVTGMSEAKEAGFQIPICLTAGVMELIRVPRGMEDQQDFKGRLWDTLYLAARAFRRASDDKKSLVPFSVIYQVSPGVPETKKLWLAFSSHEGFTIMLPEEY